MFGVALAALELAAASRACAFDLIGTWQLVSISRRGADGEQDDAPFGNHPTGMLIYTADGHTSVIISYDNRKRLSSEDRLAATTAEKAAAFDTSFGYAGQFTCSGDRVIHHVTIASFPNWVGSDMLRILRSADGKLTLSTPPLLVGGKASNWNLIWQRPR
jgi:hypothetical protein